jgi:glyoxylase-like metal-dependent hydrolase (beta-lactamase superfamily II)
VEHYRLEEIADGVLAAIARPTGGGRANAAIVRLDRETLVFDTGMTPQAGEELREAAQRLGRVRWVVNSHWHGDHIRGNQAFADAEIVATSRTKELIETRAAEQLAEQKATDFDALLASLPGGPRPLAAGLDKSLDARIEGVHYLASTIAEVELRAPTRTFEHRLELATGCELITLGGGHTESDAFLVLSERRVAAVGDLLCVDMHPWIGHGDPDRWIETLDELETLDVARFVPGHGRVATVADVRALREHLRAFLADPEKIESLYPNWDFWGDTADRNRAFLRERAA